MQLKPGRKDLQMLNCHCIWLKHTPPLQYLQKMCSEAGPSLPMLMEENQRFLWTLLYIMQTSVCMLQSSVGSGGSSLTFIPVSECAGQKYSDFSPPNNNPVDIPVPLRAFCLHFHCIYVRTQILSTCHDETEMEAEKSEADMGQRLQWEGMKSVLSRGLLPWMNHFSSFQFS